jgi:transposase
MKSEQAEQIEFAAFVGLDWADQEHAVCLQESDSAKVETSVLKQTARSLGEWANQLRARFGGRKVAVCLEQSKGALIYALMSYDFLVLYPVNPQTLAKYRKAFRTSGAKDDPDDASLLRELVKLHRDRLRALVPDDVQTRTLQMLVVGRRRIVGERTRLTNRLTSLLKAYYPAALEWAGELKSLRACDFLKKWPTLEAVKRAKGSELKKFYRQHGSRNEEVIEERIKQIRASDPLTQDQAVIRSSAMLVAAIVSQLPCVIQAVDEFDQEIARVFGQHPDHDVFNSFPGAGSALAPRLLTAMGSDRSRYESANEVQQFSGVAPVTERSGKSKWVHRRFACPKFVRQTFHEFAKQSIIWSKWAHAYYDQQRQRGKHHHAAIRALAYKWIRIIFRCWMDRTVYNEQAYVEALRRRGSRLVPSPASSDSQA